MTDWQDEFPQDVREWMHNYGLEPRAGTGVWMKEISNRDGHGYLKILGGERPYWRLIYSFDHVSPGQDHLRTLEAEAKHYQAFEPLLMFMEL